MSDKQTLKIQEHTNKIIFAATQVQRYTGWLQLRNEALDKACADWLSYRKEGTPT